MIREIITYFGGTTATATALGIAPSAVSQWIKDNRIPPQRAIEIEALTGGTFRAVDICKEPASDK
jgi:DNA-binding transcriptional regulator YdaS (Cro superfamily)